MVCTKARGTKRHLGDVIHLRCSGSGMKSLAFDSSSELLVSMQHDKHVRSVKQYRYVNLIRRPDTIQYVFYRLLVIISSTKKLIGHKAKLPQQWTDFFHLLDG